MNAPIHCPACRRGFQAPSTVLGKPVKCPACGTSFVARATPARPAAGQSAPGRQAASARQAAVAAAAPGGGDEKPLSFKVVIKNDPQKLLKGKLQGELTAGGLMLRRKKEPDRVLRPRIPASYRSGNRLVLPIDGRPVEVAVVQYQLYQQRLAKDLADYLSGRSARLEPSAYRMPWSLLIPAGAALGIPLVTLGGAIPAVIGGGLAILCLVIARTERFHKYLRILASWGLVAAGYAFTFFLMGQIMQMVVGGGNWQEYTSAAGQFSAQFPGKPEEKAQDAGSIRINIVQVLLPVPDQLYQVQYFNHGGTVPDLELFYDQMRQPILSDFPGGTLQSERKVTAGAVPGREFTITMKIGGIVLRRVYLKQSRVYLVTYAGKPGTETSTETKRFFDSFIVK